LAGFPGFVVSLLYYKKFKNLGVMAGLQTLFSAIEATNKYHTSEA
jgi:hypothetical protein